MMRFPGILFDLDGTLIDTMPDLAAATNAMRLDVGRAPLAQDLIATFVGKGTRQLVTRALQYDGVADTDLVACGLVQFQDHYRSMNGSHSQLYPDVLTGLQQFQAQGARLALVTNKDTEFTLPLLKQQGLTAFFDTIVCGDTCARKKPDPLPLFHACDTLQIQPADGLFIGDSINDAQAARGAGMCMLAVPYGYNEGKPVQDLPADAIVGSILDAAHWWAQANSQTDPT